MKHTQRGAGLLETMIALFVLAIGLLGFAALLTNSLTMNQRAFTLSQAMMMAQNYAELMRMNRSEVNNYQMAFGESAPTAATNCLTATCTASQLADWDKAQWFSQLQAILPGSDAEIEVTASGDEFLVNIQLQYVLRLGRVGAGDAASVTQMENILTNLSSYRLTTEI